MAGTDPHQVCLTGENSCIRLGDTAEGALTSRPSHWRVLWSPAGAGHVWFLQSGLSSNERAYLERSHRPDALTIRRDGDEEVMDFIVRVHLAPKPHGASGNNTMTGWGHRHALRRGPAAA